MKTSVRPFVLASTAALACFLVSCAGSIESAALVPAHASASRRTSQAVNALVSGGGAGSSVISPISNEDFKRALESSLVKSGIFKSAGGGGYQLEAFITSVEQPMIGISMRVNMEVSYALKRGTATVWRKTIKSTYSAPMGEAFVGAVRVRKATEGAARENITNLIQALDKERF
jgi:hypothetical protein